MTALDVQYRHDVRFNVPDCSNDMIIYHRAHYVMFHDLMRDDAKGNICGHVPVVLTWQHKMMSRVWALNHAPWMAFTSMIIIIKMAQWCHRSRRRELPSRRA